MESIKQIIAENQDEFNEIIIKFIENKMQSKTNQKNKKAPKTICHFTTLGKRYDSNIFTDNYTQFLLDVSSFQGYGLFQKTLGTFIKENINEFTDVTKEKSSIIPLKNGGYVSCYSSTERKLKHINNVCDELSIPVSFDFI
jgi:hypothetical protein